MKKGLIILSCLVFLAGASFSAMAGEGVTDKEIHIGQWGPQTGPAAAWGSVARGTGDYFKWINANGGIHGRKIVYHMFDDGYNPAKTKAGVKELQENTGIGRIPIFPVIPLALDCACLPSASGSSNALLYKMIAA
ncbi:MAG: ABC transporter substrate-binding protein [Desulfobacter sp.]|nr:MAG: ABC transporter substrate-binding protein [Desulfobacter sp.]